MAGASARLKPTFLDPLGGCLGYPYSGVSPPSNRAAIRSRDEFRDRRSIEFATHAASDFGVRAHTIPVVHNVPPSLRLGRARRLEGLDGYGQIDTLKPFGSSVLFQVFLKGENRVAQTNPSRGPVARRRACR